MTSNDQAAQLARRQGIAALVQRGELRHESKGMFHEPTNPERAKLPDYDAEAVVKVFPDILNINFEEQVDDEGVGHGFTAILMDGRSPDQRVALGATVPETTEILIEKIREHYRTQFGLDKIESPEDVFGDD